eukprot:comp23832_c0_seq2/m.41576 comp23832_c0_seq2/g.41576  ORF comp23832_c0_seq2/g.41576 comp23832_c0_seq2/m.41576 type:complete len:674 (-) comp23832_c0_seq2:118-2139(-)
MNEKGAKGWVCERSMENRQVFPPPPRLAGAYCTSQADYERLYRESLDDPDAFWARLAADFHWEKRWEQVQSFNFDLAKGPIHIRWFAGAQTNVCYNLLDRHIQAGHKDRVAYYWEGNEPSQHFTITYGQLHEQVCRFANVLLSRGVKKGDRVALYLPMIVELVVGMLACARIGACHSVVFGGFSSKALADRIYDSKSKVLITCDGVYRGTKLIELVKIADSALALCEEEHGHSVETVVVVRWTRQPPGIDWGPRFVWWDEAVAKADPDCPPVWLDAEDPLFMLYTSGSQGKPKGVVHTVGGYMVYAATTFKYVFDYHPGDVYWCTADIGWITGHSYIVYGPLGVGASTVLFEGIPTYPDPGRFWAVCAKYKVTQFYTAPTAIRALMRHGDHFVKRHDLSSLRVLGTVGEPINPEAWLWYYHVVGNGQCAVVDTYWQTETGGHVISPLPGAIPMKPGACCVPFFGVDWTLVDQQGQEVKEGDGYIVFRRPMPGLCRTLFGDPERYERTYFHDFPGYYNTGDGGYRDKDGMLWVTGRMDDVMSVSGHRIGTAEVESALTSHEAVSEAATIEVPHEIKGGSIHAYVILKDQVTLTPELEMDLRGIVRAMVGAFATPDVIKEAPGLPKTRSGKIMRRILRKIATHQYDNIGDTSTIAEPDVVEALIRQAKAEARPAQ